jgi:hypothetical protein
MQKKKQGISRKDVLNMKESKMASFISNLNSVVDAVYQKNKKDNDMQAIKDKFDVVRKENPIGLVEMAGPYIWKYREKIKNENTSFFLNNSFEEDIQKAREDSQLAEITEYEDVPVLLNKIKRTWHSFMPAEQQILIKKIQALLADYVGYISSCRALKPTES